MLIIKAGEPPSLPRFIVFFQFHPLIPSIPSFHPSPPHPSRTFRYFPSPFNQFLRAMSDGDSSSNPATLQGAGSGEHSGPQQQQKKSYHKKTTGQALQTANSHSGDSEMKLFGSCFW